MCLLASRPSTCCSLRLEHPLFLLHLDNSCSYSATQLIEVLQKVFHKPLNLSRGPSYALPWHPMHPGVALISLWGNRCLLVHFPRGLLSAETAPQCACACGTEGFWYMPVAPTDECQSEVWRRMNSGSLWHLLYDLRGVTISILPALKNCHKHQWRTDRKALWMTNIHFKGT